MEAQIVDLRYYKAVADKRNVALNLWKAANEKLADLDGKRDATEDMIELLEDDMHSVLEHDSPVDLLEYAALKAEMALTVEGLDEINQEAASTQASVEKLEEEARQLKKIMLDMKRILQNRGKVIPFRKEANEGE
jgi:chromosome segregation ATPase